MSYKNGLFLLFLKPPCSPPFRWVTPTKPSVISNIVQNAFKKVMIPKYFCGNYVKLKRMFDISTNNHDGNFPKKTIRKKKGNHQVKLSTLPKNKNILRTS